MTVYDQAHELEENLPAFLGQAYEPGHETIVVDETSTDNTDDILTLLRNNYPHLYTTFLPKPNRLVVRRRLALSIGVKAAKYEWVIFTKIGKKPAADDILQAIDQNMDNHTEIVLGYISKKSIRLQPFTYLTEAEGHILKAERKLRKVHERQRMNYMWGRYDFIIIRKEQAHELLKSYEQQLSALQVFRLRMHILWQNLIRKSSTTVLTTA